MAGPILADGSTWEDNMNNFEKQNDEIQAIKSFYENTDDLAIIQEASIDDQKLFTLQFKIKLETKKKPCLVEIWLPVERVKRDELKEEKANGGDAENKQKLLERSISGHHAHTEFVCEYLLPLTFNVVLPVTYPSSTSPVFSISSNWLNKEQLSRLCSELDKLWHESFGIPIIYTWVEWLQSNTVEFLDIFEEPNKVIATPFEDYEGNSYDSRASCIFNDVQSCIFEFLSNNYVDDLKDFRMSLQTCGLCLDEKYGSEFINLNCNHRFCSDCIVSFCQMHVNEGSVQCLRCPDSKCDKEIASDILKLVLNEEEYERWERLLLQYTIDSMGNAIYCPRCNAPILSDDPDDQYAFCFNCNIDLCRKCQDLWHVGECKSAMERIENKIKEMKIKPSKLLEMTDEQLMKNFSNYEEIKKLKEKTIEIVKNEAFMKNYKSCPKCRASIERFSGCNKVICRCGTILCYLCGMKIRGYEHFDNKTCTIWSETITPQNRIGLVIRKREAHPGQEAVNQILNNTPNERENGIKCITCGQLCIRNAKNNHIKCWLCSTNFCFCCKKKIQGVITAHYRNGTCKQHSD